MSDPVPDLQVLLHVAGELDARAERLRARATSVGASPNAMGWHSRGARAFARSVEDIGTGLLLVAGQLQQAADRVRSVAATAAARAAGR